VRVHLHDYSTQEMLRGLRDGKLHVALLIELSPKVSGGIGFSRNSIAIPVCVAVHPAHPLARGAARSAWRKSRARAAHRLHARGLPGNITHGFRIYSTRLKVPPKNCRGTRQLHQPHRVGGGRPGAWRWCRRCSIASPGRVLKVRPLKARGRRRLPSASRGGRMKLPCWCKNFVAAVGGKK